jgi:hypothetical protein
VLLGAHRAATFSASAIRHSTHTAMQQDST